MSLGPDAFLQSVRIYFRPSFSFTRVKHGTLTRNGVEDTTLKAKHQKNIRGQGPSFRGQTLSRPRIGMGEAEITILLNYGCQIFHYF